MSLKAWQAAFEGVIVQLYRPLEAVSLTWRLPMNIWTRFRCVLLANANKFVYAATYDYDDVHLHRCVVINT